MSAVTPARRDRGAPGENAAAATRLPDFVVIGAQKSASTFVLDCLRDHPDIYMPPDEVPLFEDPEYGQGGMTALAALFAGHTEPILGFKRPVYIGKPEVPARITRHLPDAKLVAVLRDPVKRAVSAYFHYVNFGFIPALDIETGMPRILSGELQRTHRRAGEIIEFGLYGKHLTPYGHYFDTGRIRVLLHEDILADKRAEIQRIYRFLGADPSFVPPSLDTRPQAVIYNMTRLRIVTLRNRFLFEYSADRTRLRPRSNSPLRRAVALGISAVDRAVLARLLPDRRPTLSADLTRRLHEIYDDDIGRVEGLIGRDLGHWKLPAG